MAFFQKLDAASTFSKAKPACTLAPEKYFILKAVCRVYNPIEIFMLKSLTKIS
jgi:hypothetical protein